jgi:hypothetical protein
MYDSPRTVWFASVFWKGAFAANPLHSPPSGPLSDYPAVLETLGAGVAVRSNLLHNRRPHRPSSWRQEQLFF